MRRLRKLPRRKNRDLLFFLRTKDLAPDRFSHIPASALFRLNFLYNDGARISLMSEHAPAFFMTQLSTVNMNIPMIVMDGAGIYDAVENAYVSTVNITPDSSRFWPAADYAVGRGQKSFDKQYLRDWLKASKLNGVEPAPQLPADVVEATVAKYREAATLLGVNV